MKSVKECIEQLKTDLLTINNNQSLEQGYDGFDNGEMATTTKAFAEEMFKNPRVRAEALKMKLSPIECSHVDNYQQSVLQAAWNVADILSTVNVENTGWGPAADLVFVTINLSTKKSSNGKTHGVNLTDSLCFLDPDASVPYIVDETTYQVARAIDNFVNNMRTIPQGRALISASGNLGNMSFNAMQKAVQERIKQYDFYRKTLSPPEELVSEIEADDEGLTFHDAEEGKYNPSDIEDDECLTFYDAELEQNIDERAIKEIERIAEERLYTSNPSFNQLSDDDKQKVKEEVEEIALGKLYTRPPTQVVKQTIDQLARNHEDKEVTNAIYKHFEAFEQATILRLTQRIKSRFSDDAQKKRCEDVIDKIKEIRVLLLKENVTLAEIENKIVNNDQYDRVFAQNRSKTWFRKYISEPFERLKQWIRLCCQLKTPLGNTNTLEQFKQFKKGFDDVKQASLCEAEPKANSQGTSKTSKPV